MDYSELRDTQFNTILLKKLKSIKEGEFPRLFKHDENENLKESPVRIPREQISEFEDIKRRRLLSASKSNYETIPVTQSGGSKKVGRKSDFNKIMQNRERLRKSRHGYKDTASSEYAPPLSGTPKASTTEKIKEGKLKAWVDNCYETIHHSRAAKVSKDVKYLVKGDTKRNEVDHFQIPSELPETESSVSLDVDLSDQQGDISSVGSEAILRQKAKAAVAADQSLIATREIAEARGARGRERPERHLMVREGVNFVLEDFYIRDSNELKSLAYDEELYAYDKTDGTIVGSWRVNAKVCEDKDDLLNVHFEGLIAEPNHTTWVMYSNGIVDRTYCPITEFRIEQEIEALGESRSKIMFMHKKQRKWLFDVREAAGETETSKSYTATYQHMQRVLTESAHLLLVRKAIVYRYPLNFEENDDDYECMPCEKTCFCSGAAGACGCKFNLPLKIRKKCRLQMRAFTIGGDLVRSNYRFYTPVKVRFHGVDLKVVRVRRRVEMPGKLIQTSNYFITTAGQLMAVTFNDPYPYDTNYYLQIDPKSVLDPSRVIPPERIVPLRERYMCDPELRQFYEDEVQRFISINQTYLEQDVRQMNGVKSVFQDLLNDKPHRVIDYVKDFFFVGYKLGDKKGCGETRRRRKLWKQKFEEEKEDDEDTASKYN